ncbi:hypothetical protein [Arsenophonus apicola]|uniref:Uncharacterized protein n=1 Tax=Arsenophonus apicola TaxID=2879119 RepID=A0ABY8NZZ6_9GAMM|nr:hypothetical protein [Arsenophonus apicola]WGO82815.1 hypothetical protein QG404_10610 [Arsenophonus apicola]
MNSYNIWQDFYQLTHLSIDFPNSVNNKAAIYGNGKNQVEVMVTLRIIDKSLSPISLKEEDVREHIFLCDFFSGNELKAGWKISDKDNGYNKVIEYIQSTDAPHEKIDVMDDGFISIRKFVCCDRQDNGIVIAGGIDIPGVGKFNTSQFGTSTKNGPNGKEGNEFKNPKNITIIAREPIRYSDKDNITIQAGVLSDIADLNYQVFGYNSNPSTGKGKIMNSIIKIFPSKETGINNFFKEHLITYKAIKNRDVSQEMSVLKSPRVFNCFSILKEPHYPCAVIGKYQDNNFNLNLWYSMNDIIDIDGFYIIDNGSTDSNMTQFLCNAIVRKQYIDDRNGSIYLVLYKNIIFSTIAKSRHGWKDVINNPVIEVVDSYGNEGNIELTFDSQEHFDIPAIV